nr:toxin-antitoxin system protein [uncultured Prevotella sp.]
MRTDVLDILKKKAALANRTLNNYVESLLIKNAYSDEPNETTKTAISEVLSEDKNKEDTYGSVDSLMNELMK